MTDQYIVYGTSIFLAFFVIGLLVGRCIWLEHEKQKLTNIFTDNELAYKDGYDDCVEELIDVVLNTTEADKNGTVKSQQTTNQIIMNILKFIEYNSDGKFEFSTKEITDNPYVVDSYVPKAVGKSVADKLKDE